MKNALLIFLAVALAIPVIGQAPPVQWQRSLGGTNAEELFDIRQTIDGGYVMTGYATSDDGDVTQALGEEDLWVVKLDSAGTLQWERSYGGSGQEIGRSIAQTADGGYIVGANTWSNDGDVTANHGDGDLWVVRLDNAGDLVWEKNFGGPLRETPGMVAIATNGEFFVTSNSKSNTGDVTNNNGDYDFWIVKLATNGDLIWERNFGGSAEDWVDGICSTSDGGVIVSGYTYSTNVDVTINQGVTDAWLIKLAANGDLDWKRTYGGTHFDSANDIQQTTDGGYIVAGSSYSSDGDLSSNSGGWDMWLFKLDQTGDMQWHTSIGGSNMDLAMSVDQTADDGFIVAGHSTSSSGDFPINQGDEDTWLLRFDPAGTLLWKRSFGGSTYDWAAAVQQTSDGGYILGGTTFSNNGDVLSNNGFTDCLVVKFAASDINTAIPSISNGDHIVLLQNPVEDQLVLDLDLERSSQLALRLYNGIGQELTTGLDEFRSAGPQRISIPVHDLRSGIYHLQLRIGDRNFDRKWVKL